MRALFFEIKQSWQSILQNKRDYLFLFIQFILFSDMLKDSRSDFVLFANIILSLYLVLKYRNLEIAAIVTVMISYSFISLFPIIMFGTSGIMFNQYIGYGLKLLNACLLANYFKVRFIYYFENLVFILACISLPLFIVQVIDPHIYNLFTPLSRVIMEGRQDYRPIFDGIYMHQYLIIYVMNGWGVYRNSGFMWEPAAFGAMLSWALLFNMYLNNFNLNTRMLLFIVIIFTTFSLGAMSYLAVIILIFLTSNFSLQKISIFTGIILVLLFFLTKSTLLEKQYSMMTDKTEIYSDVDGALNTLNNGADRTNRVAGVFANINSIKKNPLGYGMNVENYVESANGLVNFLFKWGIFGLIVLLLLFAKFGVFLKKFFKVKGSSLAVMLTAFALIFPMFGNPFYNHPFFLSLLVMPLFFRNII